MTDDQILAVVQAHKEGKKIQTVYCGNHDWRDVAEPCWNFSQYDYRVAHEHRKPREWSVVLNREGDIIAVAIYREGHEVILVREVLP